MSRKLTIDPNRRPSFEERRPSALREIPAPDALQARLVNVNDANSYLRCYVLGECSVIVTKEYGRWHLSIAHTRRYPTWDEIAEARYRILPPDITAALILPPKEHYVNLNKHCFQVVEVRDDGLADL